jgi:hypothetical protein
MKQAQNVLLIYSRETSREFPSPFSLDTEQPEPFHSSAYLNIVRILGASIRNRRALVGVLCRTEVLLYIFHIKITAHESVLPVRNGW